MSDDYNINLNISEICRLCLTQEGQMLPIFDCKSGVQTPPLPVKIMTCASVKVVPGDGLPELICHQCALHVDSWYRFKKQCQSSDVTLRQYISRQQSDSENADCEEMKPLSPILRENLSLQDEEIKPPSPVVKEITTRRRPKTKSKRATLNARRKAIAAAKEAAARKRNVESRAFVSDLAEHDVEEVPVYPDLPRDVKMEDGDEDRTEEQEEGQTENNSQLLSPLAISKDFRCQVCHRSFSSKSYLRDHQAVHSGERSFSCSGVSVYPDLPCDVKMEDGDDDRTEEQEEGHTENNSELLPPLAITKGFPCQVCHRSFSSKSYLRDHQAVHSGERSFSCSECGKAFYSDRKLALHVKTHSAERPCLCSVCGKAFREKSDLKKHFRLHSDESPFLCNVCGKTFKTKFYLTRHLMIHSGEKRHTCAECGKAFTWRDTLMAHAKVHARERPLACSVCSKGFKRKEDLVRHMRIHTGEKPFVCPYCERRFSDKWNLTQHVRLHTGQKPYVCSVCNQAFTHNVTLRNHVKQHHPCV